MFTYMQRENGSVLVVTSPIVKLSVDPAFGMVRMGDPVEHCTWRVFSNYDSDGTFKDLIECHRQVT